MKILTVVFVICTTLSAAAKPPIKIQISNMDFTEAAINLTDEQQNLIITAPDAISAGKLLLKFYEDAYAKILTTLSNLSDITDDPKLKKDYEIRTGKNPDIQHLFYNQKMGQLQESKSNLFMLISELERENPHPRDGKIYLRNIKQFYLMGLEAATDRAKRSFGQH